MTTMSSPLVKLGALVTAAGLIAPLLGVSMPGPLATVIYPEKFWYSVSPWGTYDAPMGVWPGRETDIVCEIVFYDSQTGARLPGDPATEWKVYAESDLTGQAITLSYRTEENRENRYKVAIYDGSYTWGEEYSTESEKLKFTAELYSQGTRYAWKVKDSYLKLLDINAPDGDWYIDGQKVGPDSTIVTLDGELALKFVATANAEKVTDVYVDLTTPGKVWAQPHLAKQSSTTWTGAITVPQPGSYTLTGYTKWSQGAERTLCIALAYQTAPEGGTTDGEGGDGTTDGDGEDGEDGGALFSLASLLNWVTLAGAVLIVGGVLSDRRRE
jgi:hypothetical protein